MRVLVRWWLAVLAGVLSAVGAANAGQADRAPLAGSDFAQRAALMRERLERLQAQQPAGTPAADEPRDIAQWFNFPNWPNWNNWANYWNNWGNFR